MIRLTAIYVLKDPRNDKIRYIGKSLVPKERYRKHLKESRCEKRKRYLYCWINQLRKLNLKPIMEIIEWVENWEEREIYWIQYYKNLGFKLTNIAVGGKGSNGHHHSKKWKEQASIRMIGNKNSLGKLHSEEWKLEASKRRSGFNGKTPAYPIYQYDANLNLIHKWNNTKEAADHYGIWNTAIINNLTGVSKSTRVGIFTKELITNQ